MVCRNKHVLNFANVVSLCVAKSLGDKEIVKFIQSYDSMIQSYDSMIQSYDSMIQSYDSMIQSYDSMIHSVIQ